MLHHATARDVLKSLCVTGLCSIVLPALVTPALQAQDQAKDLEGLEKRLKALEEKLDDVLRSLPRDDAREPSSPPLSAEPVYDGKPASYWVRALADRNGERADAAELAVGALGEAAVDGLLVAVKADDRVWRRRAVIALGALVERGGERAAKAIVDAAKDVHPLVRCSALDAAVRSLTQGARERIEMGKSTRPIERDVPALEAYVRTLEATVPAAVVAALDDKDLRVRIRAAWGIANLPLKDAPSVQRLRARLADVDPLVRREVAFALANLNVDGPTRRCRCSSRSSGPSSRI